MASIGGLLPLLGGSPKGKEDQSNPWIRFRDIVPMKRAFASRPGLPYRVVLVTRRGEGERERALFSKRFFPPFHPVLFLILSFLGYGKWQEGLN